jgi:hypothetical protein
MAELHPALPLLNVLRALCAAEKLKEMETP